MVRETLSCDIRPSSWTISIVTVAILSYSNVEEKVYHAQLHVPARKRPYAYEISPFYQNEPSIKHMKPKSAD